MKSLSIALTTSLGLLSAVLAAPITTQKVPSVSASGETFTLSLHGRTLQVADGAIVAGNTPAKWTIGSDGTVMPVGMSGPLTVMTEQPASLPPITTKGALSVGGKGRPVKVVPVKSNTDGSKEFKFVTEAGKDDTALRCFYSLDGTSGHLYALQSELDLNSFQSSLTFTCLSLTGDTLHAQPA